MFESNEMSEDDYNRGVYKIYSDEFKDYTAEGTDIYTRLNDTEMVSVVQIALIKVDHFFQLLQQ